MNGYRTIQGPVIGPNIIQDGERHRFVLGHRDAGGQAAKPTRFVTIQGPTCGSQRASPRRFVKSAIGARVEGEGSKEIAGRVMGSNVIAGPDGPVHCWVPYSNFQSVVQTSAPFA